MVRPYASNTANKSKPRQPVASTLPSHAFRFVPPLGAFGKILLFLLSLILFIFAISLMKAGAESLTPLVRDTLQIQTPLRSLGFGWLFAYLIMSGSPVAAIALTLFDAGALDAASAFAMITGSRLGASFIVFAIGFLYVLRGRSRAASMSMGLLCLTVTGTTFSLAFLVGLFMLQQGWLAGLYVSSGPLLSSLFDRIFAPLVTHCAAFLPPWGLFIFGLGVIMLSFSLFDRCLPTMAIKESQLGRTAQLVYRPWVMFVLGSFVTLISMSVSISLGILVPLSERGFIRRENVIPYIMGANVTTFIDTLIAALLLDNSAAFNLIVVQMVSIAFISALILLLIFEPYEQSVLRFVAWGVGSNRHLLLVIIALFLIPLLLVLR